MFKKVKGFYIKYREKALELLDKGKTFYNDLREKTKNMYNTNYDVGLHHLNSGNLWDATFRFKIISKFWPNQPEGLYYFGYCLLLNGNIEDAKRLLNNIQKDSEKAKNLLDKINSVGSEEILNEYAEKVGKIVVNGKIHSKEVEE